MSDVQRNRRDVAEHEHAANANRVRALQRNRATDRQAGDEAMSTEAAAAWRELVAGVDFGPDGGAIIVMEVGAFGRYTLVCDATTDVPLAPFSACVAAVTPKEK